MRSQQQTPFTFLASLEEEILSCAKGLPYHETSADNWVGVSFLSGRYVLLTPLEEVVEIMSWRTFSCNRVKRLINEENINDYALFKNLSHQ